ncbi:hypothetical protein FQN54_006892 [Arachnomyces sp. PD_36]|nr:hypothetical protein FQN54_006892 [Arachnomyces sp. PD_36]
MSRPKLNRDGDPIFEIPYIIHHDRLPPNLPKSLIPKYTHTLKTLSLLRDLWFVQLGDPDHRNYWNIRAAHNFWMEKGPESFEGGRKMGWWYEGEGEGERVDGRGGLPGNWITWGIERLEEELEGMLVVRERRVGMVRRGFVRRVGGLGRLRGGGEREVVNIVNDDDGSERSVGESGSESVAEDAEMLSLGSMNEILSSSPASSVRASAPPGSPVGVLGSDRATSNTLESDEEFARYLQAKLDEDRDCDPTEVIEILKPNSDDDVFRISNTSSPPDTPFNRSLSTSKSNSYENLNANIHPSLRSYSHPQFPGNKRILSQGESGSDGGVFIGDSKEDAHGRVRKSPKRSAGGTARVGPKTGDVAESPISISSGEDLIEL